jgi:hypothetical protein
MRNRTEFFNTIKKAKKLNWVTKIERFECLKRIKEISRSARNDDLKSCVWGGDMTAGH